MFPSDRRTQEREVTLRQDKRPCIFRARPFLIVVTSLQAPSLQWVIGLTIHLLLIVPLLSFSIRTIRSATLCGPAQRVNFSQNWGVAGESSKVAEVMAKKEKIPGGRNVVMPLPRVRRSSGANLRVPLCRRHIACGRTRR